MKKLLCPAAIALITLAGCGNKTAETVDQDSIQAAQETARQDSIQAVEKAQQDSIALAEAEKAFENPVTVKVDKSTFSFAGESSAGTAKATLSITNNTKVALEPADYRIDYTYPSEITKSGELVEVTASGVANGPQLPAGETVSFTIKASDATGKISNPKAKILISKEDFMKKLSE